MKFIQEAFDENWIGPLGPHVEAFEREWAEYTGFRHALAVNSGTAAMHLALRELGVGPGDEVIGATLTFIGSVSPATFLGATPVFIDCDRTSWTMDPALLAEELAACAKRGKLPKAVVPTDLYGQCVDMDRIVAACAPYGIPIVADSAEAAGARYKGRHAGVGAKMAVYSFNGNKIITSSGGGMLATDDAEVVKHARFLATQARDPAPHYEHTNIGYNYRMSSVVAAIGRGQLRVLNERVEQRRRIFQAYRGLLADQPDVEFMPEAPYGKSSRWLTVILAAARGDAVDHARICRAFEDENIEVRPMWKPMHLQPVFNGCRVRGGDVSEDLFRRGLCLPSGTQMSKAGQQRVIDAFHRVVDLIRG